MLTIRGDAEEEMFERALERSRPERELTPEQLQRLREWAAEAWANDPSRIGFEARQMQRAAWRAWLAERKASWKRGRTFNANSMSFGGEYRGATYTAESNRLETRWVIETSGVENAGPLE